MKTAMALLIAAALLTSAVGAAPSHDAAAPTATTRDGHSDFSFLEGTWRTHYRILRKRLVHSHDWKDCYGTAIVVPFWGHGGNTEDGDLKCPDRYIAGMTLRMYSPVTHQWSLYFGTKKIGLTMPPQVGHFENGVGVFLAKDTWDGTPVIVRYRWGLLAGNPHFEQAFSADHGKTWETNWTSDYIRVASSSKGVWNAAP